MKGAVSSRKAGASTSRATKRRRLNTQNSVERDGYLYRTVMNTAHSGSGTICHNDYLSLPAGFHMAPDTSDVRQHIVASYRWSTHIIVLATLKGYRTAAFPPGGVEFGDSQDKATQNDAGEWTCPWTCYQILVRRSVEAPTGAPPVRFSYT